MMLLCPVCKCYYESIILDDGVLDECPRGHYRLRYRESGHYEVTLPGQLLEYNTGGGYRERRQRRRMVKAAIDQVKNQLALVEKDFNSVLNLF